VPVTGSPLPGPPPFWRTRTWWNRAGRTAIAVYVATGLGFLGTLLVARGFGPHEFGTVVLAVAVASLIGTFLDLTLEEAVVHHGYRALARGDTAGVLGLIRASLMLDVSIGIVVSSGVVLLAAPLADAASAGRLDPGLVRLAALVTLTSTADSTMSGVLQLAGRPDLRAWVMAWTNLARLIGVLVAVQVGTPAAVIVAYAAANGLGALVHGLIAWQLVRRRWWRGHSPALRVPVRELFRFGFHTSITTSVAAANGALIPVLLGRISGPTTVGNFKVAMFPVVIAGTASGPIRLVLYPEQARLSAAGDLAQLRQAIRTHTLAAFAVSFPFAVAAWFALPWLLPLIYSEQYTNAVQPARILLIAAVAQLCASWFKTLPAALGKPQLRTALTTLELMLMVALLLLLGPHGVEGAAIAYSATAVVSLIAAVVSVRVALRRAESPRPTPAVAQESVELTR
jgi:O-antigen/teichoic acid export membrane protein